MTVYIAKRNAYSVNSIDIGTAQLQIRISPISVVDNICSWVNFAALCRVLGVILISDYDEPTHNTLSEFMEGFVNDKVFPGASDIRSVHKKDLDLSIGDIIIEAHAVEVPMTNGVKSELLYSSIEYRLICIHFG